MAQCTFNLVSADYQHLQSIKIHFLWFMCSLISSCNPVQNTASLGLRCCQCQCGRDPCHMDVTLH